MSLGVPGQDPWIIDLQAASYDLGMLGAALEEVLVLIHNATFEAAWLREKCGVRLKNLFCTMTASRVHTNGSKLPNDLNDCLKRYLGAAPSEDFSKSNWGAKQLTEAQLKYSARDVAHLHDLAYVLCVELDKEGLTETNDLEQRLLPVVLDMEAAGIAVDKGKLAEIKAKAKENAQIFGKQAREALGRPEMNLDSHKQLLAALQAQGFQINSTAAEVLKEFDDNKIIPLVLSYKKGTSFANHTESLLKAVQADGRIHGCFNPTGADTGRFSAKEPNLQNIPRGTPRSCFVASLGHKLDVADYSQVELRAAAVIAHEPKMIAAYKSGLDLHTQTASVILNKSLDAVTPEDRQTAKAINFGLLYGQNAKGLVRFAAATYGVNLELQEAVRIRERFFDTYKGLRQWHADCWALVRKRVGEVRTRAGRRRIIPPDASDWDRFTALVNTPVQGGCADAIKRAMVRLAAELPATANILLMVHDELVVEAPDDIAEPVKELVAKVMCEEMEKLFPDVPIEVEASVCSNWGEK